MRKANYWIRKLRLERHPEGGYYRETYRATGAIPKSALPRRFRGRRYFSTAILFLLSGDDFSAFHRLRSDELWHFHAGCSVLIHCIKPDGQYRRLRLGDRIEGGDRLQIAIKAGWWFAAELARPRTFALVGCTVAPGFDFADFELGDRPRLSAKFPAHHRVIERLTRPLIPSVSH